MQNRRPWFVMRRYREFKHKIKAFNVVEWKVQAQRAAKGGGGIDMSPPEGPCTI
jgi:hypothetical protein